MSDRTYREEVLETLTEAKAELGSDSYMDLLQELINDLEGYLEEAEDEEPSLD